MYCASALSDGAHPARRAVGCRVVGHGFGSRRGCLVEPGRSACVEQQRRRRLRGQRAIRANTLGHASRSAETRSTGRDFACRGREVDVTSHEAPYAKDDAFACRPAVPARRPDGPGTAHNGSTMQDSFDITTIIFLALAVFVIWRLRSVLGQKTGSEQPPFDPLSRREPPRRPATHPPTGSTTSCACPARDRAPVPPAQTVPPADRWKGIAEPGTPVAARPRRHRCAPRPASTRAASRRGQGRLRDDRDGLRAGRPQDPEGSALAGGL